jgi:hypothetical protein
MGLPQGISALNILQEFLLKRGKSIDVYSVALQDYLIQFYVTLESLRVHGRKCKTGFFHDMQPGFTTWEKRQRKIGSLMGGKNSCKMFRADIPWGKPMISGSGTSSASSTVTGIPPLSGTTLLAIFLEKS